MAYLKQYYRCPTCKSLNNTHGKAAECRSSHAITTETWAIGKEGKMVSVRSNCALNSMGSINWALKEADIPDDLKRRQKYFEDLEGEGI